MSQESNQLTPNRILQTLVDNFSLSDLKLICFQLGIDYEEIAGETKTDKARELILFMQRNGRLSELEKVVNTWPFKKATGEITRPLKRRNKSLTNLLRLVQTTWVEGVLHQSLQSAVLLQLDLTHTPDAIKRSQPYVLKQKGQMDTPVPVEQTIDELFEAHGRNLLILGEPGSGKTFTMLQLAEVLIQQAEVDPRLPVPVVLNLASWAEERKSLVEWIVDELLLQYQVPRKLCRAWLEKDELSLLLDGLDEVDADHRDACIVAINSFKATHAANVVVCSRIADYEQLQERLNLGTAVTIQPLTEAEIDRYLAQEALELQAVLATLKHDEDMRELVQAPLMLTIMTLAYRGMTVEELRSFASIEARRDHLFSEYVTRVFERRPLPEDTTYDQPQALQWLAYLAAQMINRAQTAFFIERLQPDWLLTVNQRRFYKQSNGLIFGLLFGLSIGLLVGLLFGLGIELIVGLLVGLLFGWVYGVSFEIISNIKLNEKDFFFWKGVWPSRLSFGIDNQELNIEGKFFPNQGIWLSGRNAIYIGLITGILAGPIVGLSDRLPYGLSAGLSFGLIFGLFSGSSFGGTHFLNHFVLRCLLGKYGYLPARQLVPFLDEMAARILLRKVGGGYIFIHRTLQEYLAKGEEGMIKK